MVSSVCLSVRLSVCWRCRESQPACSEQFLVILSSNESAHIFRCDVFSFPARFRSSHVTGGRGFGHVFSLYWHVRPVERAAAEQHVPDESVDRCFTDQSYKEQLFDDLRRNCAQRRESQ